MIPTNYLPIVIFFFTLFVGIVAFFLKDFHLSMKQAIDTLTEAVNKLTLVITTIQANHEHLSQRVDHLEMKNLDYDKKISDFFKEYQSTLDFVKNNQKELNKLL